MFDEELCELGVVAADVFLICQKRWVVGYHRGERGAKAKEPDELILCRGKVALVDRSGGDCGLRGCGGVLRDGGARRGSWILRCDSDGGKECGHGQRTKEQGQDAGSFMHFGFPS
jgi:hypothetical protein